MTISAKIDYKLKRLDIEAATCKAHIIYFGEDQAKGNFSILKKEAFDMSPTKAVATHNAEPFITTYDSDNKGQGNIGGYKYDGYLLVVLSEDGELILNKTSISKLEKQLEEIPALSKKILAMKGTSGLQGIDL